jgi:translation initiation factor 2B subunit (eIF-2B alpha/beta/delta family)
MSTPLSAHALRHRLAEDSVCESLFNEAEALATDLFDGTKGDRVFLPFFTEHSTAHLRRVEEILDEIIFGVELDSSAFNPTAEEAMYLLSATWLHDIGMIYGILHGEKLPLPDDWPRLRDTHEERSSEYIQEIWQANCSWRQDQRVYLSQLCIYHRRKNRLERMEPALVAGKFGGMVRLRELAGLLRLADGCHIDASRAPGDMKNLYTSLGMPAESRLHWGLPKFVEAIQFDHSARIIRPMCLLPPPKSFGTVTVDFRSVVDKIVEGLRDELSGVLPYLVRFSNTAFKEIEPDIHMPLALGGHQAQRRMLDMWPYMLTTAMSASEVASMLAALVDAVLHNRTDIPTGELKELLDHAARLHPYNFLIRRLELDIRKHIKEKSHPSRIKDFLTEYMQSRVKACHEVAQRAKKYLGADDVLVIYDFSQTVMTLITEHLTGFQGKILVVECRRWMKGGVPLPNESSRVRSGLDKLGLHCVDVQMASLPAIFSYFKKQGKTVKVLLTARGIFNGGDALCTVGSTVIAALAKTSGMDVYILAEREKYLKSADLDREIEQILRTQARDLISSAHPSRPKDLMPEIDCLTPETYTALVGLEDLKLEAAEGDSEPASVQSNRVGTSPL